MKLGTALTFYAKYPREMSILCAEERFESQYIMKTLLPWISDGTELKEIAMLIEQVAEQSRQEVTAFLKLCTDRVLAKFEKLCNVERRKGQDIWEISLRVWPKKAEKNDNILIGICICTEEMNLVARPFIWLRGGRKKEPELAKIFGREVQTARDAGTDWAAGGVRFPKIPIEVPIGETNIDADLLLDNILEPLFLITEVQLRDIFKL